MWKVRFNATERRKYDRGGWKAGIEHCQVYLRLDSLKLNTGRFSNHPQCASFVALCESHIPRKGDVVVGAFFLTCDST